MKLILAAGGTGGHIFPALSVAQEWRRCDPAVEIHWVGTTRNREQELCSANGIDITVLNVSGMPRVPGPGMVSAFGAFAGALGKTRRLFKRFDPDAVIAFGGYVCGPVLTTARLGRVPYFLHEQNTVPGMVNRMFSGGAAATYLGFPLEGRRKVTGKVMLTGNPVRKINGAYEEFVYPQGFDRARKTVLICGGSQGALSMNRCLVETVKGWLANGIQVVWQTGDAGLAEVTLALQGITGAFVYASMADLYPWYAAARVVVGRAGASTISEAGYFGLPCVLIPLPWSAENHQYFNAGLVEGQGWGRRVSQDENCGTEVDKWVREVLDDDVLFEQMSRKALDHTPANSAATIVNKTREFLAETTK